MLQLHPDSRSDLLNHHLARLRQEWLPELTWPRSCPYGKQRLYYNLLSEVADRLLDPLPPPPNVICASAIIIWVDTA